MPSCTLRGHPGWQRAPSLPLLDLPHSQHSAHVVLAGTACRRRGPPGHASASLVDQAGGMARRPSSWLGGPPRALSGLPDPWDPRRGPGRAWARGPRQGCHSMPYQKWIEQGLLRGHGPIRYSTTFERLSLSFWTIALLLGDFFVTRGNLFPVIFLGLQSGFVGL